MRILIFFALCLANTLNIFSQDVPNPAPKQSQTFTIVGATAHIGNGQTIENSVIECTDGKITKVANKTNAQTFNGNIIEATGKQLYPGFIAANTTLGLFEIEAARATLDMYETGDLNPNARSIIAYNTDSRITPTVRANGILTAEITPVGGFISGTSSVVQLDAWNYEDAIYKLDNGIHINWPQMYTFKGWWAEPEGIEKNEKYTEALDKLKNLINQAKSYCNTDKPTENNLKLQALCGLFNNTKTLFVHVNLAKEIIDAINFAKNYNLNLTIVGGAEAWRCTQILKDNNIPVILVQTHALPMHDDDNIKQPYQNPALLEKEGILYCLTGDANWDIRNLPFEAGTAASYGLSKEKAIQAITLNAAKILGIDKTTGSIEVGKDATLFISAGDALDMKSHKIEKAFIQGREINLGNRHKDLNKKFMDKYNLK